MYKCYCGKKHPNEEYTKECIICRVEICDSCSSEDDKNICWECFYKYEMLVDEINNL